MPAGTAPPYQGPAPRQEINQQRIIRSSAATRRAKAIHGYACQICGLTITGPAGVRYSEGAHIKPLGRPHDGPDHDSNILCLCPNHHAMLDLGAIVINPAWEVLDVASGVVVATLSRRPEHVVDAAQIAYHHGLFQP